MSTALTEMQYDVGGLVLGPGTPYVVSGVDFGSPEVRSNDADMPREDGLRFGRDYRKGRLITFDLNILTVGSALGALAALESAWLADAVRDTPGAVTTLRMCRDGRTRKVFGRPRKFASVTGRTKSGWIPVTCEFQCVDHRYYSDVETQVTYQLANPSTSGMKAPLTGPITTTPVSSVPGSVTSAGNLSGWLVSTVRAVNGSLMRPSIEVVGAWTATLDVVLQPGEQITIDPRPWVRTITRNGTANAAGALAAGSPRLSQMTVPPGQQNIVLRGTDSTGTATLNLSIADAWTSY